jgi:hypothetical protein
VRCSELSSDRLDFERVMASVRGIVDLLNTANLRSEWTLLRLVDFLIALELVADVDRKGCVGDGRRVVFLQVHSLRSSDRC